MLTERGFAIEKQHKKTRGMVPIYPQTMANILAAVWDNKEIFLCPDKNTVVTVFSLDKGLC
jgi:hypothetical protein